MPAGYVQHTITGSFSPESYFRCIEADHPHVFWLDDSLGETVSYIGWGIPATERSLAVLDTSTGLPVSLVGWISYLSRDDTLRPHHSPREVSPTDTTFLRVSIAVRIDHVDGRVDIIADEWNDETVAARNYIVDAITRATDAPHLPDVLPTVAEWRDTPEQYADMIRRCQHHIVDGDAYQLCLTTSVSVQTSERPADVYLRLRRLAPTRTGGFIRSNGVTIASASPEVFVDITDGVAVTKPIKGTRPRSENPAQDFALIEELRNDPKERAENLMIVDLSRNDLSRVSYAESVTVPALFDVETYSTVHQLVSTVTSQIRSDVPISGVVSSLFPAGSMTGAPKLRAVEILEQIESGERGIYSGAFGHIGGSTVRCAMTIRAVVFNGRTATVGVGGGITSDSVPLNEVREVGLKANALLTALGAEPNPFLAHR